MVFLDSGILGGIVNPNPTSAEIKALKTWADQIQAVGHALLVPAIADYEQRREHQRRNAATSLKALDDFISDVPGRYLPLTDSALKKAAELWADVRNRGLPTADVKALDCDIVFAAQVIDLDLPAGSFVVVTGNVAHLSRVIVCERWRNIVP